MAKIGFHIATPSAELYSADADMVLIPSADGDMGVLAGHCPVIGLLRPGTIIVTDGNTQTRIFIAGGFMEVNPEKVTVLAEHGTLVSDIDIKTAKSDLQSAKSTFDSDNTDTNKTALLVAQAQVDAVENPQYQ